MKNQTKKLNGISPLISVIMLIAFALLVAGIFYGWASQFVYTQREEFQFCSNARIVIQKAYYNPDNGRINVVVYNTGNVPLKGFSLILSSEKKSEVLKDFWETELAPNEIGLFPVDYDNTTKYLVVQSRECKNAQDMISIFNVEGIRV